MGSLTPWLSDFRLDEILGNQAFGGGWMQQHNFFKATRLETNSNRAPCISYEVDWYITYRSPISPYGGQIDLWGVRAGASVLDELGRI